MPHGLQPPTDAALELMSSGMSSTDAVDSIRARFRLSDLDRLHVIRLADAARVARKTAGDRRGLGEAAPVEVPAARPPAPRVSIADVVGVTVEVDDPAVKAAIVGSPPVTIAPIPALADDVLAALIGKAIERDRGATERALLAIVSPVAPGDTLCNRKGPRGFLPCGEPLGHEHETPHVHTPAVTVDEPSKWRGRDVHTTAVDQLRNLGVSPQRALVHACDAERLVCVLRSMVTAEVRGYRERSDDLAGDLVVAFAEIFARGGK